MLKNPKIGVVTVLYNCESVLDGFFKSLNSQTYRNIKLYIVDNNSSDGGLAHSRKLAAESWVETEIFDEKENWGIAKGNNIGIRKALADGCDYVLLANNDTEFAPTTIETMLEGMSHDECRLLVPKIYYYDSRKIWCAGGRFGFRKPTYHYGAGKDDSPKYDQPRYVEYSPTCFMLIDREVFEKVGLMDERYFVYFDDTDFVWRAVKIHGYKLKYEPKATLLHKVSSSTKKVSSYFSWHFHHRNSAYFMNKYFPIYRRWFVYAYQTGLYFLKTLIHPEYPRIREFIGYYKEGIGLYHDYLLSGNSGDNRL